ncbi:MAG TPA: efflux RND transporter permease subunit, partial [Telluria sp.]|nr:efflux RND transporter permease subunit [Telluria sp.]
VMLILAFVVGLNVYLFSAAPKGFFPQQDTGQISGGMRADQSISFQAMQGKLRQLVNIIKSDPAVATVVGFTGGSRAGGGFMFINLKPVAQRAKGDKGQAVIARLRPQLARVTGVSLFLNPVQDLRMGGRSSNSTYQYTLKSDNSADLKLWATKLADAMKRQPALTDVDTDQAENGVETYVKIDKDSATRLGISTRDVDNALYNGFGQRQVATIYDELNQYHIIMGVAKEYAQTPEALRDVYVPSKATAASTGAPVAAAPVTSDSGTPAAPSNLTAARDPASGQALSGAPTHMVPLSAIASFAESSTPTSVNHQDGELATTVSYNLADGSNLADGQAAVHQAEADIGLPNNVRGSFQGTAKAAQESNQQQPLLILAAIVVIYIVLGILYESLVHPITVLSTLPSAGVGAVLALLLFKMEFT